MTISFRHRCSLLCCNPRWNPYRTAIYSLVLIPTGMRDNELDFQLDSAIVRPLSTSPISPRSILPSTPQQATLPIPNGTPRLPLPCRHLATDYASPPAGRGRVGTIRGPAGDRAICGGSAIKHTGWGPSLYRRPLNQFSMDRNPVDYRPRVDSRIDLDNRWQPHGRHQ